MGHLPWSRSPGAHEATVDGPLCTFNENNSVIKRCSTADRGGGALKDHNILDLGEINIFKIYNCGPAGQYFDP